MNGNRAAAGLGGGLAGLLSGALLGAMTADTHEGPSAAVGGGPGALACTLAGVGVSNHYLSREVTLVVKD